MSYGQTEEGFVAKPQTVIETEMKDGLREGISPNLNLESTSLLGQLVGIIARQLRQLWEAGQANASARDPDQATGAGMVSLAKVTGTRRKKATASTAELTCTLAAGTYPKGTLIVSKSGDPTVRFYNKSKEVFGSGGAHTGIEFVCEDKGPIQAAANTLTVIASPVTGFTAATNPEAATLGTAQETITALRSRRNTDLAQRGSTSVNAIRAKLLAAVVDGGAGATSALVLENEDDDPDANGTDGHGIQCVVQGGEDADVARIIWNQKAAGIKTTGTTTETVVDSSGTEHDVNFVRPTGINFWVTVDADVLDTYPVDEDSTIEKALLAVGNQLPPGRDVIYAKVFAAVANVPGVVDINDLFIGTSASPSGTVNLVAEVDEYYDTDLVRLDVTTNVVGGEP